MSWKIGLFIGILLLLTAYSIVKTKNQQMVSSTPSPTMSVQAISSTPVSPTVISSQTPIVTPSQSTNANQSVTYVASGNTGVCGTVHALTNAGENAQAPYTMSLISQSTFQAIAATKTDRKGTFAFSAPAGDYGLSGNQWYILPMQVHVKNGFCTTVTINADGRVDGGMVPGKP